MIARRQKTCSSSWMQCLVCRVLFMWGPEYESLPQVFQYYVSVTFKCQCQCNPTASTDGTAEIPLAYNMLNSRSKKALVTVITGQTAHGDLGGPQHCCCEHRIDVNEDTCWHSEGFWRRKKKQCLGIFLVLTVQFSGSATSWPVLDDAAAAAALPLNVPTPSLQPQCPSKGKEMPFGIPLCCSTGVPVV